MNVNELTRIISSSFSPHHRSKFPNFFLPTVDPQYVLTFVKWTKKAYSSNCICSRWTIQFIYSSIYVLCLTRIELQFRPLP